MNLGPLRGRGREHTHERIVICPRGEIVGYVRATKIGISAAVGVRPIAIAGGTFRCRPLQLIHLCSHKLTHLQKSCSVI